MVYPGSSLFWPYQNTSSNYNYNYNYDYDYIYPSPSSSVDCTLSLAPPSAHPTHRNTTTPVSSYCRSNTDTLLAGRRCANCDTTSTPLWRNGPRGPKSLCNACGIRFKKEERRAAAASTTTTTTVDSAAQNSSFSWGTHHYSPQKIQGTDSAGGIQLFSWISHDRPTGLLHHFTR